MAFLADRYQTQGKNQNVKFVAKLYTLRSKECFSFSAYLKLAQQMWLMYTQRSIHSKTNETWLIWLVCCERFGYRTFPNWCRQYRTTATTIPKRNKNRAPRQMHAEEAAGSDLKNKNKKLLRLRYLFACIGLKRFLLQPIWTGFGFVSVAIDHVQLKTLLFSPFSPCSISSHFRLSITI